MGNYPTAAIDPVHLRMYGNLIQIHDPYKRVQVIQTCLASPEYIHSAKRSGVYSYLLQYLTAVQSGMQPTALPGESASNATAHATASIAVPRSMQSFHPDGIGATHPSMLNAPNAASYQRQVPALQSSRSHPQQQLQLHQEAVQPSWKIVTDTPKQKALSYFSSCLEVLGIQEEIALTEEALKKAYKRAAIRAHPDKGGTEEKFEAVTRAYAYLSEILRHMTGGRKAEDGRGSAAVPSTSAVQSQRSQEADQWAMKGDPIRLNPKNLDMNAFNQMFQQTHIPDPDADGYGDWLKSADSRDGSGSGGSGSSKKFKGEFNRDVFNRMFEEDARQSQRTSNQLIVHPGEMALTLNPNYGVEIAGEKPSSFTAASNARMQYTDLRGAYTTESTVSDKVADVRVADRSFDQYKASRERAPDPFSQTELHAIQEFEQRQQRADQMLERRKAEMAVRNQSYFDRMKQMVLTDGAESVHKGVDQLTYQGGGGGSGGGSAIKRIGY